MLTKLLIIAFVAAAGSRATAATVTYTFSKVSTVTNWTDAFVLPQFNPALGTLTGVTLFVGGTVSGIARAESLDSQPSTLTLTLAATLRLRDPSNAVLVSTIPLVEGDFAASAYDGTTDFGGTSGTTISNFTATNSNTVGPAISPALIATFQGIGNVSLAVSASGTSSASGSGNVVSQFNTNASGSASVTYDFIPIPESGPAALALLALAGAGLHRRRLPGL